MDHVRHARADYSRESRRRIGGGRGSESSLVQVSEAPAGERFGAPQTLLTEAARRLPVPEDQLGIAGDGNGGRVVQWQIGQEHAIETALQGSSAQPFAEAFAFPFLRGEAQLYGTLMDEAGETLSLLRVPSGISEGASGVLAVVRERPGGIGGGIEYLVPARAHARVEDAHLAVRPDGSAAAVWVEALCTSRGADERELSARVLAVSAQPGATDPLSLPGHTQRGARAGFAGTARVGVLGATGRCTRTARSSAHRRCR